MMNCDWVIHLAAHLSFWELDNDLFRQVNVEGTRNVMECALENKVQKVINVSAILNFGKPNDQPFNEDSQPGPRRFSRYGQTKYEGEQIAREMYQHQGLPLITIFPCAVLGLGDQKTSGPYISDVVNGRMPAQVFTDVPFTWVSVQDVAQRDHSGP
jgi:dihydroflavonol-4-reductase